MKNQPGISSKLPNTGTTIFSVMSAMAEEYDAINLSQGFPDFNCPEKLIELVHKYMQKGYNQYAPMQGVMPLREAIAEKTEALYSHKYDPQKEITITAGATQAIYAAISALVKEEDEVILFEPVYDSYVPAIRLNGGIPVFSRLKPPDYKIDWEELEKSVSTNTRMIIINTPHNPTGTILTAEDMERLIRLTSGTNILILSDEVYEHVIYEGYEHQSISRYPRLAERGIMVGSFGKMFHTTGWKVGYCLAPEYIMEEIRKIHQFMVYCVNTPVQYAMADFLKKKSEYLELSDFFQKKRDLFLGYMKESRFKLHPSSGTYFQLADYSNISDEKEKDFAVRLTKEYGVAVIPVSEFYHDYIENTTIRICFAKSDDVLKRAAEKLVKA